MHTVIKWVNLHHFIREYICVNQNHAFFIYWEFLLLSPYSWTIWKRQSLSNTLQKCRQYTDLQRWLESHFWEWGRRKWLKGRKEETWNTSSGLQESKTHKFLWERDSTQTNGDFNEGGHNASSHLFCGYFPSCLRHGTSTFYSRCRGSPGLYPPFLQTATCPYHWTTAPIHVFVPLEAGWDLPFYLPCSKRQHPVQADCSCKASTGTAAENTHAHKNPQTRRSPDCPPKRSGWAEGTSSLLSWKQLVSPLAQTKLPSVCQLRQLFGS